MSVNNTKSQTNTRVLPRLAGVGLASLFALGACVQDAPESELIDESQEAIVSVQSEKGGIIPVPPCPPGPTCDPSIDVDLRPSLLLTRADPGGQTILDTHFQLTDVLQQLIDEAGIKQTPTNLFRRLWDTQNDTAGATFTEAFQPHCDDDGSTINGFPIQCPRADGGLSVANPSDFVPIAVFNRFDLAATDGSHCGEYRIIYAMTSSAPISGRDFIIFEGQLPNPNPSCGVDSCRPVAEFWAGLSNMKPSAIGDELRDFYFDGLPNFGPVITPNNYGFGSKGGTYGHSGGQIRTNQFGNFQSWQLREFQLAQGCVEVKPPLTKKASIGPVIKPPVQMICKLFAKPVTVKDNPFGELFNDNPSEPLNALFQADFINHGTVSKLAATSLMSIGLGTDDLFNAGQSTVSGNDADHYPNALTAGGPFANDIQTELTNIGAGALTPDHIARRALTQSCAGCHQLSNNADLGGGLTWPSSAGFVHVHESGFVSNALTTTFLPHREQVLETFLQACTPTLSAANKSAPSGGSQTKATLGGSATH